MPRHSIPAPADPQVIYRSLDFLGYPDYRVGDDGSVWSRCRHPHLPWRQLHPHHSPRGYAHLYLCNDVGRHYFFLHVLILTAFVGPRPEGMWCRHLDGDPGNNALSNLRWGTQRENEADKGRHGRKACGERHGRYTHPESRTFGERNGAHTRPERRPRGEGNGQSKLSEADVRLMRHLYAAGGWTLRTLAARFGVSFTTTRHVISRLSWTHLPD
jgi:hypothetical protein